LVVLATDAIVIVVVIAAVVAVRDRLVG